MSAIDPTKLTTKDLARLLSRAGAGKVKPEQIDTDLQQGAPTNPDGTIHLIHYTAWLAKHTP